MLKLVILLAGLGFSFAPAEASFDCSEQEDESKCLDDGKWRCKWSSGRIYGGACKVNESPVEKIVETKEKCDSLANLGYHWRLGQCAHRNWLSDKTYISFLDKLEKSKIKDITSKTDCEKIGNPKFRRLPVNANLPVDAPALKEDHGFKEICLASPQCAWKQLKLGNPFQDVYVCYSKALEESTLNDEDLVEREKKKQSPQN